MPNYNWGKNIGPIPVNVHDSPVAMRRFSLKYVFSASELADDKMPAPAPTQIEWHTLD